ncbi:MAG: condensation domain-containing protein [Thermoguttaceae bacterium]
MENMAVERKDETPSEGTETSLANAVSKEPFSLFEEYMIMDDTPQYPMNPILQLRLKGVIDRAAARSALNDVIERQPLLKCCVEKRGFRYYWVPTHKRPAVTYVDFDADPSILNESGFPRLSPIDLFSEPGCRIFHIVSRREDWTLLVVQVHHATADGVGVAQILNEWSIRYSLAVGAAPPGLEVPHVDEESFQERRKIGWTVRAYFKNFFHTMRSTSQLAFGRPRPLIPVGPFKDVKPAVDYPHMRTLKLTRSETDQCIRRAKELGVTVNDSLLATFFLTLDKWLTDVRRDNKSGSLRVMAPINMRTDRHRFAPLSNVVSTVFLDRSRRFLAKGAEKTLESVVSEMRWIKKNEQRYDFLLVLRTLHRIPGSLPFFLHLPTCRATGVFSNLGRYLDKSPLKRDEEGRIMLGDARIDRIESVPPIRYKTNLAIAALTYAGELDLGVSYDPRLMTGDEAQEFLKIFRSLIF